MGRRSGLIQISPTNRKRNSNSAFNLVDCRRMSSDYGLRNDLRVGNGLGSVKLATRAAMACVRS